LLALDLNKLEAIAITISISITVAMSIPTIAALWIVSVLHLKRDVEQLELNGMDSLTGEWKSYWFY
jgi:hypothetical protein